MTESPESTWVPDVHRDQFRPRLGEVGSAYVRLPGNTGREVRSLTPSAP